MNSWLQGFLNLLFPPCCVVCGKLIATHKEYLCMNCFLQLPRTNYHLVDGNRVEKLFWGKVPVVRASSYFFYEKNDNFHKILYELKYYDCKQIGEVIGRHVATELLPSGFFNDVDLLLPIPLHQKKLRKRGYNQSEWIAKGISQITSLPIDTKSVRRAIANPTQTRKGVYARWENVEGIFALASPDDVRGKHVLLIDDVLTTGATITSCACVLAQVEGTRVSILTLAAV